jgi:hypothetical protein
MTFPTSCGAVSELSPGCSDDIDAIVNIGMEEGVAGGARLCDRCHGRVCPAGSEDTFDEERVL